MPKHEFPKPKLQNATRVMYGLVDQFGHLAGFSTTDNGEGDCCPVKVTLEDGAYEKDSIWLTHTYAHALRVAETDTEWFNADYDTPSHGYLKGLRPVRVTINVEYPK